MSEMKSIVTHTESGDAITISFDDDLSLEGNYVLDDQPRPTVFEDIDFFQSACGQEPSPENYVMYLRLIEEEYDELCDAVRNDDKVEQLDALIDILVVTMGAIRAADWDGQGAWDEVMKTNFAKIDPETGKVHKREDGKILKPKDWVAPNLSRFVGE